MPRAKPKPNVGAALRFNALRHGLTSSAPVIPGVESVEECPAHREVVLGGLPPAGSVESALEQRVAGLTWRLRRVERYECESIAVGRERVDHDFAVKQALSQLEAAQSRRAGAPTPSTAARPTASPAAE